MKSSFAHPLPSPEFKIEGNRIHKNSKEDFVISFK